MKRENLEHIIRAATTIADDQELVIIGSQAVLGQFPDAPVDLCVSNEADVYPRNHPERWELIDGSIGELSPFHETFGYYAQGVEPKASSPRLPFCPAVGRAVSLPFVDQRHEMPSDGVWRSTIFWSASTL
jgi:hypothetical protein